MNLEENFVKKIIGETPEEQYENSEEEFSIENIASKTEEEEDVFAKDKKDSSINEVISKSADEKEKAEKMFSKLFSEYQDGWKEFAKGKELKKSEEQIRLIEIANDETNGLLEKYGVEKFDVSNVHLFSEEDMASFFSRKVEKNRHSYWSI